MALICICATQCYILSGNCRALPGLAVEETNGHSNCLLPAKYAEHPRDCAPRAFLLDNRASIDEFGDWMLLYAGNVIWEGGADNATRQLAYAIQSSMTTFGTGHIDEETLRQQLAKAIKPFSSPTV